MTTIVRSAPDFGLEALEERLFHIVLVHPEIPQNAGSIARLAAGSGAWLHFVEPLGFVLDDRYLKRAGLDYWPGVKLSVHPDLETLESMLPRDRTWLFSKRASCLYRDKNLQIGTVLVFGCETRGLPQDFVERWSDRLVRIPTTGLVRSLNLANSVSIGAYEVLRQLQWCGVSPMT